jgi:hypothetical protein
MLLTGEKSMAETVVLKIPEALYQRLAIAADATQRSPLLSLLETTYDRKLLADK